MPGGTAVIVRRCLDYYWIGDVMTGSRLVKKQARDYLKGSWGAFAAAFFALFVPFAIVESIDTCVLLFGMQGIYADQIKTTSDALIAAGITIFEIVVIALFLPMISGIAKMSFNTANGKTALCSDIFSFFKRGKYLNALSFNLNLAIRRLFWTVVAFIPAGLCLAAYYYLKTTDNGIEVLTAVVSVLGVLLAALGIVLTFVFNSKYFLADYIYAECDGNAKTGEVIRRSIYVMRGNKDKFYALCISFIPWLLLSLLILPGIYTFPYMQVSFANSAKWIIKTNEQNSHTVSHETAAQNTAFGGAV